MFAELRRFAGTLCNVASDPLCDDAVQRVMCATVSARTPFKGDANAQARSWLRRAFVRELQRVRRERARATATAPGGVEGGEVVQLPALDVVIAELEATANALHATWSPRRKREWLSDVRLYLESVAGTSTETQVRRVFGAVAGDAVEFRRARNAIYQRRFRGRAKLRLLL